MSKLNLEARMTIQTLVRQQLAQREIARLLGVTEGAVRYQIRRMTEGKVDGRSNQPMRADAVGEAIAHWREQNADAPLNLCALHDWLVSEHDYRGSLRSVQRYWRRAFPAPALRARRRVETPPGAQAQVDWAHFPRVIVGGCYQPAYSGHSMFGIFRPAPCRHEPLVPRSILVGFGSLCKAARSGARSELGRAE